MGRKLTHEQFVHKYPINKNIEFITKYSTLRGPLNCKCKLCGNIWRTTGSIVKQGCGCPKCGEAKAINTKKWNLTHQDFLDRIDRNLIKKIEVLTPYLGRTKYVSVRCLICNYVWKAKAYYLYANQGCSRCGHLEKGKKSRISEIEFRSQIQKIYYGDIVLESSYITGDLPISFKCNICKNSQNKRQARQLLYRGCMYCNFSKGEYKISKLLELNGINYIPQYKFQEIPKYRFDFAILDGSGKVSYLIEYDGTQHYKSIKLWGGEDRFNRQKEIDNFKNTFCSSNNIKLIRIPFTRLDRLEIEDLLWETK